MSKKILLTPEELKAQAAEMSALSAEYESLFSDVSLTLKNVNTNWSANLSRNFEGKINSAQNSFKVMTEKLSYGAAVADASANTFESVDSLLAKQNLGDGGTDNSILSDIIEQIQDWFSDADGIDSIGELFAYLEEKAGDDISQELLDILKIAIPDDLEDLYKAISGWAQGDLETEDIYDVLGNLASKNPKVLGVIEAFKYTFEKGVKRDEEMMEAIEEQLKEWDVLGVGVEMCEGFVDIIIAGSVECLCSIAGTTIDGVIDEIPVAKELNQILKYLTGKMTGDEGATLGDLVGYGGDAVSEFIDSATDVITDVTDTVTSGITSGVKGVVSWIGGLFG